MVFRKKKKKNKKKKKKKTPLELLNNKILRKAM